MTDPNTHALVAELARLAAYSQAFGILIAALAFALSLTVDPAPTARSRWAKRALVAVNFGILTAATLLAVGLL